jgi:hypothetical protein
MCVKSLNYTTSDSKSDKHNHWPGFFLPGSWIAVMMCFCNCTNIFTVNVAQFQLHFLTRIQSIDQFVCGYVVLGTLLYMCYFRIGIAYHCFFRNDVIELLKGSIMLILPVTFDIGRFLRVRTESVLWCLHDLAQSLQGIYHTLDVY